MKKLEIVINSEKLEDLKKILSDCNANGVMISNVMGYGNQKGYKTIYRGTEYSVNL
ncbi:MAG: P-II family nitrogen regulator, partial [Clostridium butyricum]